MPSAHNRPIGRILLLCAAALIIWLWVCRPGVGGVVATVLISVAVAFFAFLVVVVVGAALLYWRAKAEVATRPAPESRPAGRRSASWLPALYSPVRDRDKNTPAAFWGRLSLLLQRFAAAVRPEYVNAAIDEKHYMAACGHVVYIYVRGPRTDEVRSVHRDLDTELNRIADAGGLNDPDCDAQTLRRLGDTSFTPRRRDWQNLADRLETPRIVLAGARLLLLLNPRWREAANVYFKLMFLAPE
jgi:hypothetical protein